MLAAVLSAAHCARRSQQELRDLATHALQALRLAAVATVERLEETAWQDEAARDAGVAEGYEQAAEWASHQEQLDAAHAIEDRQREKYHEHVAERDQEQADRLFEQARRDDAVRLELLQNLTADQEREAALEQQERDAELHSGIVCGNHTNKFVGALCRAIGGTTDLPSSHYQKLIEDEKLQMVHESQQLTALQKHEFLEQLVGNALQGQAARYNATAAELRQTAQEWDSQAARAAAAAARDREEAVQWTTQEHTLEARVERTQAWEVQNESLAQTLWRRAERDGHLAERHALEALVLALVGLVYFLPRVVRQSRSLVRTWYRESHFWDSQGEETVRWWHTASYFVMHCILVLLVTGMVDRNYLLYLENYDILKRAVIILWFAYLVAGLQTILLHSLPHCWAEYRRCCGTTADGHHNSIARSMNFYEIAGQFLLRLLVTLVFAVLEFLILWLTVRGTLFAPDALDLLSRWYVRYAGFVLLVVHVVVFGERQPPDEQQQNHQQNHSDGQSTVLLNDDDEEVDEMGSEMSPLRGSPRTGGSMLSSRNNATDSISSSPTKDLPNVFFDNMRRAAAGEHKRSSVGSSSVPHAVNLQRECFKLGLTLEVLLTICALCVLRYGVAMAYLGHPWTTAGFVLLSVLSGVIGVMLFVLQNCRRRQSRSNSLGYAAFQAQEDLMAAQKKLAYGSVAV